MSTFAKIDSSNTVVQVIVAEQDFIDSGALGPKEEWIECCLEHSLRGRYPGIGYYYDIELDEFLPPKPPEFPSWVWNNLPGPEGKWTPPKPFPGSFKNGKAYDWDETIVDWKEIDPSTVTFLSEPQIVELNMGTVYIAVPDNVNVPPQ